MTPKDIVVVNVDVDVDMIQDNDICRIFSRPYDITVNSFSLTV